MSTTQYFTANATRNAKLSKIVAPTMRRNARLLMRAEVLVALHL